MIVTFSCQKNVFVYSEGCGYSPMFPYKTHSSINSAIDYLKRRGINDPKVITK